VDDTEFQLTHDSILYGVRRGPLIIAALVVIAALLAVAIYARVQHAVAKKNDITLALAGPLPIVEPLILQEVSKDVAKKVNDATPFAVTAVPPAAPFRFDGGPVDMDRATDCLASTIFYEAGAETVAGQMAVVQVVLNRVRHPAYPHTVCGVVFQGHERRTGCQFSYTCDGSMVRRPSAASWDRFRALGRSMLTGLVYAPVGTATHYHTDWVLPKWSATLDKVRAEGTHLFFRWRGPWGTPKAFRARYSGGEQAYAKLALLSTAHRTADMNLDEIMKQIEASQQMALEGQTPAAVPSVDGAAPIATPIEQPEVIDKAKDTFFIRVDPRTEPSMLTEIAERTCGSRDYCKVMGWVDRTKMPKGAAVDEAALASLSFSFLRNKYEGFEKSLWNCTVFARADKRQCMRRRVIMETPAQPVDPETPDAGPSAD
jgi:Cell Wall Hydrolase